MSETTPPDAGGFSAMEVLRAWFIGDVLHCSLDVDLFEDPAAWGELLADLARHIATGLHEKDGRDAVATLKAVRETFARELEEDPAPESGDNEGKGE